MNTRLKITKNTNTINKIKPTQKFSDCIMYHVVFKKD